MDISAIRREVGPQQCLFANADSYLLLQGDRAAIAREVERQVAAAGRDGAFIMGSGSPICDATDPAVVDFWLAASRAER
jgi:uroporphyrinogen-III decarboxylase